MSDEDLWKSPRAFAEFYHGIDVSDPLLGLDIRLDIRNYISGWGWEGFADNNAQYWRQLDKLVPLLAEEYAVKNAAALNIKYSPVYFRRPTDEIKLQRALKGRPGLEAMWAKINPFEEFYMPAIRRAYEGRASPHEIRDALRLALATGLAKNGAAPYAKQYFGLDCNTFVGNWLGISPSTGIAAYAHGYGKGAIQGATADVVTTRDWLPLSPVAGPAGLKQGNVLTTYSRTPDRRGRRWRHIALVQEIKAVEVAEDGTGRYLVSLAEWGQSGDLSRHVSTDKPVTLKRGRIAREELPKVEFFYSETTVKVPDGEKNKDETGYKLFFDSSKLDTMPNRGFHVGGTYGT